MKSYGLVQEKSSARMKPYGLVQEKSSTRMKSYGLVMKKSSNTDEIAWTCSGAVVNTNETV